MNNDAIKYWNERSIKSFKYKGEYFYTISPIPYYYKMRSIILNSLIKEINFNLHKDIRILDFGCGDGFYLNYLNKIFPKIEFSGYDVSEMFILKAREILHDNIFLFSNYNNIINLNFDIVYSIFVLAHISNDNIYNIFKNIYRLLRSSSNTIMGGGYLYYVIRLLV